MRQLVLASASPSRRELLQRTALPFVVAASDYPEDMSLALEPRELAKHISQSKAHSVALTYGDSVILAADSFALFGKKLLGKPHTVEQAVEMLSQLNGTSHSFLTGFTLLDSNTGEEYSDCAETTVFLRRLTEREIRNYVAKEPVLDKAGAYTIQGLGCVLVDRIDGDFTNVMGLPLAKVVLALTRFGIRVL